MSATRHTEATGIAYHRSAVGDWRHVDTNDAKPGDPPRHVGPQYRTQAELLADHEDYMHRAGWLR